MKRFIFPRSISKIAIVLVILGIGIGIFVTAQWKTKTLRVSNSVTPYVTLSETRDQLTRDQANLKKQILDLRSSVQSDQDKLKKQSQSKSKVEDLDKYKIQAGLTEKRGEGVVITMDDARTGLVNIDSITHAADLRDLVNFLWGIGAQAISINGERVVYDTSIDCIVNTILINSTKTTTPFSIFVIGDQNILKNNLDNENNLKDIHKRAKNEGLIFEVSKNKNITVPAYDGSFTVKFAKIVQ